MRIYLNSYIWHLIVASSRFMIMLWHGKAFRVTGPYITNVIATCRKTFSQWERSFLWKLRCHWLKFLQHVAKTLVIQGPGPFEGNPLVGHWTGLSIQGTIDTKLLCFLCCYSEQAVASAMELTVIWDAQVTSLTLLRWAIDTMSYYHTAQYQMKAAVSLAEMIAIAGTYSFRCFIGC